MPLATSRVSRATLQPTMIRLADVLAGCVRTVDGLIPAKSPCMTAGNAYSGRQLRQTGHTNLARALQSLDPAVTAAPP